MMVKFEYSLRGEENQVNMYRLNSDAHQIEKLPIHNESAVPA